MKFKKLWSLLLLISLSFSATHDAFIVTLHDDSSVVVSVDHGHGHGHDHHHDYNHDYELVLDDSTDIHDIAHVNYILTTPFSLAFEEYKGSQPLFQVKNYPLEFPKDLLRPPTTI